MISITNALPGALLLDAAHTTQGNLRMLELTDQIATDLLNNTKWQSAVGHTDTAAIFSSLLGLEILPNRTNLTHEVMVGENSILAGLYSGPRLPEGATTLPEGAKIRWALVYADSLQSEMSKRLCSSSEQ